MIRAAAGRFVAAASRLASGSRWRKTAESSTPREGREHRDGTGPAKARPPPASLTRNTSTAKTMARPSGMGSPPSFASRSALCSPRSASRRSAGKRRQRRVLVLPPCGACRPPPFTTSAVDGENPHGRRPGTGRAEAPPPPSGPPPAERCGRRRPRDRARRAMTGGSCARKRLSTSASPAAPGSTATTTPGSVSPGRLPPPTTPSPSTTLAAGPTAAATASARGRRSSRVARAPATPAARRGGRPRAAPGSPPTRPA